MPDDRKTSVPPPVTNDRWMKWKLILGAILVILLSISAWVEYKRSIDRNAPVPKETQIEEHKESNHSPTPLTREELISVLDDSLQEVEKLKGYTCLFIKRNRSGGKLNPYAKMKMKCRHHPFSIYFDFLAPPSKKGQEAIYVEGKNDNEMIAHGVGILKPLGTVKLNVHGTLAMTGNRHPISESGLRNLLMNVKKELESGLLLRNASVSLSENHVANELLCRKLELTWPRPDALDPQAEVFAKVILYLGKETQFPIRFERHIWVEESPKPVLLSEYIYSGIQSTAELTDLDFDPTNPDYRFP